MSFVKPSGWVDGHPASSKLDLLEGFVKKIVDGVQANKDPWKDTAILVTMDEGGGYYDSGYVQALDFLNEVSKFTKAGHISHDNTDHVSILKFIEHNRGSPRPKYDEKLGSSSAGTTTIGNARIWVGGAGAPSPVPPVIPVARPSAAGILPNL